MQLRTRQQLPALIIIDDDGFPESALQIENNMSINKNKKQTEGSRGGNSNSYLHYTNNDYNSVNITNNNNYTNNNNSIFALCLSYLCNMVD